MSIVYYYMVFSFYKRIIEELLSMEYKDFTNPPP